jgi:ABC-type branched-subunit amino acid transport system substrate-binding protein
MRHKAILLFGPLMLLAAACGTAVSDQQAASELRAEGGGGALSAGGGSGTLAVGATSGDAGAGGTTSDATGGQGQAAASGGATPSGGAAGSGAGAAPVASSGGPIKSAGGATDVGVTPTEINLGWVGTLTGPVPGIFRGALVGTQAWINYQNSQGGLMGRQLKLIPGDDSLDSGKNRAAHLALKDKVFSFVGSFSINDDGGAPVLGDCKCPDISGNLSAAMHSSPYHFGPQPAAPGWRSGPPKYYAQKFPKDVIEHLAFFYSQVPVSQAIAVEQQRVYEQAGFKVVYTRGIPPNDNNQTADVVQMQRAGVKSLVFQGDLATFSRLTAAMKQQNFKVDLFNLGNTIYDSTTFKVIPPGDLQNLYVDQVYGMFLGEDAARIPEVKLFNEWMKKTNPNQAVDLFGLYGWLSGRLFGDTMLKMAKEGKNPVRADLINTLKGWGTWDGYGLVAPIKVGTKTPSDCFFIFTSTADGKFQRTFPEGDKNYACDVGAFDPKK